MKLIIGLGNPGPKYHSNRHNVGFLVIDELAKGFTKKTSNINFEFQKKLQSNILVTSDFILAKPQTYMNSSGIAVSKIINQYKIDISNLWVIHDDLDMRLGEYKIQKGKGPKIHNGILSIEEKLGNKNFWRVRIGVDNRQKIFRIPGEKYVLQNFNEDEKKLVNETVERMVEVLINEGI
ncbi:MAG: aminoacyl-tRNA hydrolase [Candidatus Levybacteria bacterium RBG_16_35_6]|nr:MAG: aminoacyl-tRNA hydrolase [Candidatus Levybacteria bacterium RBG_16_35_6]